MEGPMRSKTSCILAIALSVLFLTSNIVFAQQSIDWGTYHFDGLHKGVIGNPPPPLEGGRIGLVWTFPRTDVAQITGGMTFDNDAPSPTVQVTGTWKNKADLKDAPTDFFQDNLADAEGYYWAPVVKASDVNDGKASPSTVRWTIPDTVTVPRAFKVQTWVPTSKGYDDDGPKTHHSSVRVTVKSQKGIYTFPVDQRDGGHWSTIRLEPFMLAAGDYIEVSNVISDSEYDAIADEDFPLSDRTKTPNIIVCADAVRLVTDTGVEIYSSPTTGKLGSGTDQFAAVWTTTIESSVASKAEGVKDFGAIYGVYSDNYTVKFDDAVDPLEWDKPQVKRVGTAIWRYPRGGAYDDPTRLPKDRDPIEGPIGRIGNVGGIFSSPTLIQYTDPSSGTTHIAVVTAAMDGQVYCIKADDGQLLWKGPGVTISEPSSQSGWIAEEGLPDGRYDAFGGSFLRADATSTHDDANSITYDIAATHSDPAADADKGEYGHAYSIYAWIPAQIAGDASRVSDAAYKITYGKPDAEDNYQEAWVRIDQRGPNDPSANPDSANPDNAYLPTPDDPSAGRWVKLGDSYWNPRKVELSTQSEMEDISNKVVVADAIMVVPSDVGPFSYSSVVWDGRPSGGSVYVGGVNGRVYALDAYPTTPYADYLNSKATNLRWTFPRAQIKNPASHTDDPPTIAFEPLGDIVAAPAFVGSGDKSTDRLVIASMDGNVYCLKNLDADETRVELAWVYDSAEGYAIPSGDVPEPSDREAFSSSPVINGDRVYVASTGGRLHALYLAAQVDSDGKPLSQRIWMYPDSTKSQVPLPPFRYSTPAVLTFAGDPFPRIYCGNTSGKVLGFKDEGTKCSVLIDDPENPDQFEFRAPNYGAPIQSSVAIDNGDSWTGNMYCGTMGTGEGEDGSIMWANKRTGFSITDPLNFSRTNLWDYSGYTNVGSVFSSPALGNGYMYVGTGKGRLFAFSSTAFGGEYVGGGKDGKKDVEELGTKKDPVDELSPEMPQVDVFDQKVYKATIEWFKSLADTATGEGTNSKSIDTLLNEADVSLKPFLFLDGVTDFNDPLNWHKNAFGQEAIREIFYEWGEGMCLIAWNLPPLDNIPQGGSQTAKGEGSASQRASMKFRFINAAPGPGSGGALHSKSAEYLFEYQLPDGRKRSIAMARLDIQGNSPTPPSPGLGWTINFSTAYTEIGDTTRKAGPTAYLPLLKSGPGNWAVDLPSNYDPDDLRTQRLKEQKLGVNCPLAIRDEGILPSGTAVGGYQHLGWPQEPLLNDGTFPTNRREPTAHFNGNGYIDDPNATEPKWTETVPHIYLGPAAHGTNSRTGKLWVMDRSATGLKTTGETTGTDPGGNPINRPLRTDALKSFRLQPGDMNWRGGNDAVINPMPWDQPPRFRSGQYDMRLQKDYPDISRSKAMFLKSPENNDPSYEKSSLRPAMPSTSDIDNPDASYDNARLRADFVDNWVDIPKFQPANISQPGYLGTVLAFLDTNGNGRFDGGEITEDRPNTRSETYRKFRISVDVPPDYRMVVEKPLTMDIIGADSAPAPHGLGLGLFAPNLTDWYKPFTVRNMGNVNLYNIKVAKTISDGTGIYPLRLYSQNVNPAFPIEASATNGMLQDGTPLQTGIISSADRIDSNPFFITTPTHYQTWWMNKPANIEGFTLSKASIGDTTGTALMIPEQKKIDMMGAPMTPEEPRISVAVPLSQPTGSYSQRIPIYADLDNDDILDLRYEPRTEPTFTLNVTVAEDRLTGGPTPGSAIQLEAVTTPNTVYGNTTPAAWRDPKTGHVHLFWSTNRFDTEGTGPFLTTTNPSAPWYIAHGTLRTSADKPALYDWKFSVEPDWESNPPVGPKWWDMSADRLPGFDWPLPKPAGLDTKSIKHSAPWATVVENWPSNASTDKTWLVWQGQADAMNSATGKIERESRIFYTIATGGSVTGNESSVFSFARDLKSPKLNPRAIAYRTGTTANDNEYMWLTWHGGDAGKWNIFGALNISSATSHDASLWSGDVRFPTPSSLVSVSEPTPLHVSIEGDHKYLDIVYTGVSKYDQSTDLYVTRYAWTASGTTPSIEVIKQPRVINEELRRDTKLNVYTAEHVSWWMKDKEEDVPYIKVVLPDGTEIFATHTDAGNTQIEQSDGTQPNYYTIDRATGVYHYTYAAGSPAAINLGQMIVDYSAGIVRFTKSLPTNTRVYADYTPRAKRLTRGPEQDSTATVFIEKANDRKWLFWRKPATSGVQASTIYYKTYRVTANLPHPVEIDKTGQTTNTVTILNSSGAAITVPFSVSWDGKKIYFPADMERYPGMKDYPGQIGVKYTPKDKSETTEWFESLTWEEELSETALPTRMSVNEGQVAAFADPASSDTRVWVFWSSTRAGQTDLYYQTISPNFRALY